AQRGLEQGKQALRPVLMHLTTGIFLLRMINIVMEIALHSPIAARRVGVEPAARLDRHVRYLLDRLYREIAGRVGDACPLATDPGDKGGAVFVVMAPPGLTLFAAPSCAAAQRLLPALVRLALLPSGVIEVIRFHGALQLAVHLVGPNLAKPQNLAKETWSDSSTRLKRVPKVRFSHVTTHFASLLPPFCWGLRLRYAQNFAVCPLCVLLGHSEQHFVRSGPYNGQISRCFAQQNDCTWP